VPKREDRIFFRLECSVCKSPNYTTTKNKRNDPDRMELSKYCRRCRRHQLHRESKIS
jgi:large subunit ribosomal protein L33